MMSPEREQCTFICTPSQDMAGPTNNWMETKAAYAKLSGFFSGCMKGRTMYVVPFVMGPIGSPLAKVGVQLTDSIYVAVSMGIMTRMGRCRMETAWAIGRRVYPLSAQPGRLQSRSPLYLPFPAR